MKLGIFGGSFDPIHNGHLTLARCCLEQAGLDKVWFLPAARQPLKTTGPHAEDGDRCQMIELAIEDEHNFRLCKLEIDRGGVSYTVDTLQQIREARPGWDLFFLLGADSLRDLPSWHEPAEILKLATPLVVHRAGEPAPDLGVIEPMTAREQGKLHLPLQIDMPATPISSSEIRQRLAAGKSVEGLVPLAVADFIEREKLYGARQ